MVITVKSPTNCTAAEVEAFRTLTISGGEVAPRGLDRRIADAHVLAFAHIDQTLTGIAALKNPDEESRARVFRAAHADASPSDIPFELGWVYVSSEFRGQGLAHGLVEAVIPRADGRSMYATTGAENRAMASVLAHGGFQRVGQPYKSNRTDRLLALYLRVESRSRTPVALTRNRSSDLLARVTPDTIHAEIKTGLPVGDE